MICNFFVITFMSMILTLNALYVYKVKSNLNLCAKIRKFSLFSTHKNDDIHFMRLAIRHAQYAFRDKEVPVGAVIVDDHGMVLAASRNRVEAANDVTMHAEIDCIRKVSALRKNWRLLDCTLYTTLEPCPMCLGAILSSRIKRVIYGAKDIRLGACGSYVDLNKEHPFNQIDIQGGILEDESSLLLRRFFRMRRKESQKENEMIFRGENFDDMSSTHHDRVHTNIEDEVQIT